MYANISFRRRSGAGGREMIGHWCRARRRGDRLSHPVYAFRWAAAAAAAAAQKRALQENQGRWKTRHIWRAAGTAGIQLADPCLPSSGGRRSLPRRNWLSIQWCENEKYCPKNHTRKKLMEAVNNTCRSSDSPLRCYFKACSLCGWHATF